MQQQVQGVPGGPMRPWRGASLVLVFTMLGGIVLPVISIMVETTSHIRAQTFFDPIPTLWHVIMVVFVPLAHFQVWLAVDKGSTERVGLQMASSASEPERRARGLRLLRDYGNRNYLLRACYQRMGETTDLGDSNKFYRRRPALQCWAIFMSSLTGRKEPQFHHAGFVWLELQSGRAIRP